MTLPLLNKWVRMQEIWLKINMTKAYFANSSLIQLKNKYKSILKPLFDFFAALIGFLILSPIFLIITLLLIFAKDRKSTRLNSSHVRISYAVFCLKKKK